MAATATWLDCVDDAAAGAPSLALVRPPGHHATKALGCGTCLFCHAAAAARYALTLPGIERVAILDVDAHHGSGTAHNVQDLAAVRFVSVHEFTLRGLRTTKGDPRGSGKDDEGPLGNIRNVELPKGCSGATWLEEIEARALPFLADPDFGADLLIVSLGLDTLDDDVASGLTVVPRDYGTLAEMLQARFGSRVAFGLEGGYDAPSNLEAVREMGNVMA